MDTEHLFREVGETIFLAQTLETNIRALVEVLNRRFDANIDDRQIIMAEDRHTLGRLIDELRKHGESNQEFTNTLREALEARNYVAHEFFIRNVGALSDEAAYASALRLLGERQKRIAAATAVTAGFVKSFSESLGIKLSNVVVRQDI